MICIIHLFNRTFCNFAKSETVSVAHTNKPGVTYAYGHSSSPQAQLAQVMSWDVQGSNQAIRQLYIQRFPKQSRCKSHSPLLQSISCRMWHARREALRVRGCSIADLFHYWKNFITYQALHRQIRKQSWLNKRWKLENILTDLAFRGQICECYRKIRFCPKQPTI